MTSHGSALLPLTLEAVVLGQELHRAFSGHGTPRRLLRAPRSDHMFVFSTAHFSAKQAGDLSTLFDVGGIMGEALPYSALGSIPPFSCGGAERRDGSNVT